MRTILVLMDTLRRDALSCYNPHALAKTPNIEAFSREATIFDQHWIGSAPCMPARRDIMCGRLNFLERCWGPIEPFDITLPQCLRSSGVFTHITTDHCHYWRTGGEGYLQQFNTWDIHRGQEGDPWVSRIDEPDNMPETFYGRVRKQYQQNREMWPNEKDMPSPRTFSSACDWLEANKESDSFFLMVEAFDPHEPFDVPDAYMNLYEGDDDLDRDYFEIPPYARVSETDISDSAVNYLQRRYAALVSMCDHWFGKLIDKIKEIGIYEDTMIIVTTDHGYFLGERDYLGKNYMHLYNELAHLPMIVRYPGGVRAGERVDRITQAIDIMPTVLDAHRVEIPDSCQGVSLMPLANSRDAATRPYALYGVHGLAVNITDGHYTYFRAPTIDNKPLFNYTAFPSTIRAVLGTECPDEIECGRYFKRTSYPLFKIPSKKPPVIDQSDQPLREVGENKLFDLDADYGQTKNLTGSDSLLERRFKDLLREGLVAYDAPAEQAERLGLVWEAPCQSI